MFPIVVLVFGGRSRRYFLDLIIFLCIESSICSELAFGGMLLTSSSRFLCYIILERICGPNQMRNTIMFTCEYFDYTHR